MTLKLMMVFNNKFSKIFLIFTELYKQNVYRIQVYQDNNKKKALLKSLLQL